MSKILRRYVIFCNFKTMKKNMKSTLLKTRSHFDGTQKPHLNNVQLVCLSNQTAADTKRL